MEDNHNNKQAHGSVDSSIIRSQMKNDDVKLRGEGFSQSRLLAIKKGLLALNTLEIMAQTIYRFQITKEPTPLNHQLITAMCNEMTHYQDFQVKLYEYGFRPSLWRCFFWFAGMAMGYISRLKGRQAMLKVDVWIETMAVHHYDRLLERIDWDPQTRSIIEKNQSDEYGHIDRWQELLGSVESKP
jgi:demethoxyubiquinone hydroxylase (CLK1/Coq7/Cat5 family)